MRRPRSRRSAQRIIETREPIVDAPMVVEHPAGVRRQLLMNIYPVLGAGDEVVGIVAVVLERPAGEETERSALQVAAREAERARVLRSVMKRLIEATTMPQVATAVVEDAMRALGADAAFLAFVVRDAEGRPTTIESVRIAGYEDEVSARHAKIAVAPGRPISDLVLTGESIFVESPEQWAADWPLASIDLRALGFNSFAAVPVKVGERVVAALSFSFRQPYRFDAQTRVFLATLAEQCALALERVRLHDVELRAAERQASLLATVQDAFIAFDHELRFTYVNERALEMMHRTADEVLGHSLRRLPRRRRQAGPSGDTTRARDGRGAGGRGVQPDAPVVGQARLYPAPDGLSMVAQDISGHRRRQQAAAFLAEASRHLSASLDYQQTIRTVAAAAVPTLGDWCVVSLIEDPESDVWPPRLERVAVVAHDPEMLALAQTLTDRYPIDLSPTSGMHSVLRTGTPVFVPTITDEMITALAQDAEHLALMRVLKLSSLIMVPLVARGVTLGVLTLCMTASERRYDADDLALAQDLAQRQALAVDNARLFSQAQHARAEAEAANRAKTEFLAVMSYELRTPLSAISGYVRILDMELHGPVTEQQRTALERIRRSEVHLAEIINQVLEFAKLESGTVSYDLRPLKLGEMVADIVPRVESQRAAKRLGLQVRMPPQPAARDARVLADGDKLQQCFSTCCRTR